LHYCLIKQIIEEREEEEEEEEMEKM